MEDKLVRLTEMDVEAGAEPVAAVAERHAHDGGLRRVSKWLLMVAVVMLPLLGWALVASRGRQVAHELTARLSSSGDADGFGSRILISERTKTVYCAVPRAAPPNFEKLLLNRKAGFKPLRKLSTAKAVEVLTDPNYSKVAFVRNPVDRAQATYADFVTQREKSAPEYVSFLREVYGETADVRSMPRPSFADVLLALSSHKLEGGELMAPAHSICAMDLITYDQLGKAERGSADMLEALRRVDVDDAALNKLASDNAAAPQKRGGMLQPRERSLLRKLYARDFAAGYSTIF